MEKVIKEQRQVNRMDKKTEEVLEAFGWVLLAGAALILVGFIVYLFVS